VSATLFTASWRVLWEASKAGAQTVQPVRSSRGLPRFWPAAERFPAVELLMPPYWMWALDDAEKFGRAYRRRLHAAGLAKVQAELDAVADGRPQAVCCFEARRCDCHRSEFAAWYERKAGVRCPS
jgi:hypothetical protein